MHRYANFCRTEGKGKYSKENFFEQNTDVLICSSIFVVDFKYTVSCLRVLAVADDKLNVCNLL